MPATRRINELVEAQRETVGLATGGDARHVTRGIQNPEQKPTLAQAGIDKNLAKQVRAPPLAHPKNCPPPTRAPSSPTALEGKLCPKR